MKKPDIRPYVRQFYRGNRGLLALAVVQTLLMCFSQLLISWLIQQILDQITGANESFTFSQTVWQTVFGTVLMAVACGLSWMVKPRFIARAMAQYKNFVYEQLSKKSIAAFSGENTALYLSALSNDVNTIETGYLNNLFVILDQAVLLVGSIGLMFWYSPLLTLLSLGLAIFPMLASLLTGNLLTAAEKQVSDRNEGYLSSLRDSLTGFSVIKAFRAEVQMCRLFAKEVQAVADAQEKRRKALILVEGCAITASNILQFGVFLAGAWLALRGGDLSAGSVLVFVQLLNFVLNPIAAIPQALAQSKAAKGLIRKLAAALDDHVRREGGLEKTDLVNAISVEGLTFGYEADRPVLQDISFRFEAGKSYCLVGASGSGKSTLLGLLAAAHTDYQGVIRYDDAELQELSSESLYSMISQAQQSVFVFNASIRDNITMFADFPQEEVTRAIGLSGLRELIDQKGADYLCGENGSGLSGGEKQRIAIARSLLKRSSVLLADEVTAALDAQTAFQVSSAILDLEGLTRIVVTHSLDAALLRRYDGILAMKNGRLAETGTFEELIGQKGYFYSLYTVSQ